MTTMQILTGPLAQAIGWALLHLLWQATIVAGILAAVLALIPRQSAGARYAAACGALGLVFLMFIATAWRAYDPAVEPVTSAAADKETIKVNLTQVPIVLANLAAETWRDRIVGMVATARQSLPSIVAIWLTGVVFLSSRLLLSWMRARRLVTHGAVEASRDWQRVAARLSDALGLRKAVRLLESAAVEVPSVIGSLRPVILLPASTLTGLTPEQIEMVLAHELAHIRRHDFLVNLLQAVVETLMFYHPAVWWMSRRVREERENCCDDMAVAVCGNAIQYAHALTRLEELRSAPSLLVAANGGSLLDRIRRIAGGRAESTAVSARWAAAMITLVVLAVGVGIPSLPAFAQREPTPPAPPAITVPAPPVPPEPTELVELVDEQMPEEPEEPEAPEAPYDLEDGDYDFDIDIDPNIEISMRPVIAPVAPLAIAVSPMPAIAPMARLSAIDAMRAGNFDDDDDEDDNELVDEMDDRDRDRDRVRGKNGRSNTKIGAGQLSVDDLISLRAVGVTPEYIDSMRALFPDLTVGQVSGLKALGVSAAYVKEMRDAGMTIESPGTVSGLKAVGVTPTWIREMRDAGMVIDKASTASGLKALGVTAAWLRELRDAGVTIKSASQASGMKAVGVSAKFVKQLKAAGYTDLSPEELTRMAAVGVDEDFIREMQKYKK